jgi:hypothetical protein
MVYPDVYVVCVTDTDVCLSLRIPHKPGALDIINLFDALGVHKQLRIGLMKFNNIKQPLWIRSCKELLHRRVIMDSRHVLPALSMSMI